MMVGKLLSYWVSVTFQGRGMYIWFMSFWQRLPQKSKPRRVPLNLAEHVDRVWHAREPTLQIWSKCLVVMDRNPGPTRATLSMIFGKTVYRRSGREANLEAGDGYFLEREASWWWWLGLRMCFFVLHFPKQKPWGFGKATRTNVMMIFSQQKCWSQ